MVAKEFDGLDYTREALLEELSLMERHARDGSAYLGGCACIEEKHLLLIAGLASEGVTLAENPEEKKFYMDLAARARKIRQDIIEGNWSNSKTHSIKCETQVHKCIKSGKTEEQCRIELGCYG